MRFGITEGLSILPYSSVNKEKSRPWIVALSPSAASTRFSAASFEQGGPARPGHLILLVVGVGRRHRDNSLLQAPLHVSLKMLGKGSEENLSSPLIIVKRHIDIFV